LDRLEKIATYIYKNDDFGIALQQQKGNKK